MRRAPFIWSVAFIATSLVALAAVPVWLGRQVTAVEQEITRILEPARNLAADLATTHARQMSRFQEYLLTGSLESRSRYEALRTVEREQLQELEDYLREMDPRVREVALPLRDRAAQWQVAHLDVLEDPGSREAYLSELGDDLELYEAVLQASAELRAALNREVEAEQADMDRIRGRQARITGVLVLLALAATVAVGSLARRLGGAVDEATRRREDAVRARREIDAILEATAEAVLGLNLEGKVISLNQAGCRLLGFTEEDARDRDVREVLFAGESVSPDPEPGRGSAGSEGDPGLSRDPNGTRPPEPGEILLGRISAALREGRSVDGLDGVVHPRRGEPVEVRWSLRPLVDGTVVRGAVVTLTDVREVRAAERALRKAIRAREETMAVVGHDLRSPLNSIAAAAELLLEVPLPEERRRNQLVFMEEAADRMNRIIGDLLDVARIDAGGLHVNARKVLLPPMLRSAVRLAQPPARKKRVELESSWPADLPAVRADEHRILQVLGNLISNALRYTPSGGRVAVGAVPSDGMVEVWVRDSGSGIDLGHLPHLWDPFWQPERDRKARSQGAGLGLAIVKGIVEAHGGSVRAQRTPAGGSRFSFTLPLADAAELPRPSMPPAAPPRRS